MQTKSRLEKWKEENGHSWRTLERATKITRKALIDLAKGRTKKIKPDTFKKIRRVTGLEMRDLV